MQEPIKEINVMELLIKISNDVSSIKTDMQNLKDTQKQRKRILSRKLLMFALMLIEK